MPQLEQPVPISAPGCTEAYNQGGTQTVTLDVQALSQQFSRLKNICEVGY